MLTALLRIANWSWPFRAKLGRNDGAAKLFDLIQDGPKTWRELERAGLPEAAVLKAARDLVRQGEHRVRLGPLLLELEDLGA
jgi:hypothetical protein